MNTVIVDPFFEMNVEGEYLGRPARLTGYRLVNPSAMNGFGKWLKFHSVIMIEFTDKDPLKCHSALVTDTQVHDNFKPKNEDTTRIARPIVPQPPKIDQNEIPTAIDLDALSDDDDLMFE